MTRLRKILALCAAKEEKPPSVEYIASRMTPVDESSLRLPRSFAHTMRHMLENEDRLTSNKAMDSDKK